jgi:hypothetical protein
VAEVVEPDAPQLGLLEQLVEDPGAEVVGVEGPSFSRLKTTPGMLPQSFLRVSFLPRPEERPQRLVRAEPDQRRARGAGSDARRVGRAVPVPVLAEGANKGGDVADQGPVRPVLGRHPGLGHDLLAGAEHQNRLRVAVLVAEELAHLPESD